MHHCKYLYNYDEFQELADIFPAKFCNRIRKKHKN